ncbi:MAG: glycosyltransferase [Spirochaetes bacterium]|jgi:MGT family glycosyltransferase|nr:glycosyltransferase [Spirochaetota bacterium]
MARILVYTSPARGHLFPALGVALELRKRAHDVHVKTLAGEVERVRNLGLSAEAIAPAIEAREMDDWAAKSPTQALDRAIRAFAERAAAEVDDVSGALRDFGATALLVDTNSWGAQAVAESSGLPWAVFQPYFVALPAPGVPPFGPGLRRDTGLGGRLRDRLLGRMIQKKIDATGRAALNEVRDRLGLEALNTVGELPMHTPRVLYFTTEALEYPRPAWPANFRFTGAATWAPASETPAWLQKVDRPIALVTCSTERQRDRAILEAALRTLPDRGYFVVATSAAHTAEDFRGGDSSHVRLERFLPHNPVIERASVVVCHGGMGITQRALSHGVPVVVVPFGRDQPEVARRVEYAGAGVRLEAKRLGPASLAGAVEEAASLREGARRIAAALAQAGGDGAAADAFEELLTAAGGTIRTAGEDAAAPVSPEPQNTVAAGD